MSPVPGKTLKALGLLALLLLGIGAAWVACNGPWADAAEAPVPAPLALAPPALAPQANAFFDQLGVRAPVGESSNAYGQRVWRGEREADSSALLVMPTLADWQCQPRAQDCIRRWRSAAPALRDAMTRSQEFGQRCAALSAGPAYEELLQSRQDSGPLAGQPFSAYPLPVFAGLAGCLHWFQVTAALAPDLREATEAWAQADRLRRQVAGGAKSLVSHAMAWAWSASQTQLLAQWLAQTPGARLDEAWLQPLPAHALAPATWIKAEAHFQRQFAADIGPHGQWLFGDEPNLLQRAFNRVNLGYLPHATQQLQDALWLSRLERLGERRGADLARQAPIDLADGDPSLWVQLHWRNTLGHILVDLGTPAFLTYFLRQADASMHPELLRVVVALNAQPAAARPAALTALPLPAEFRPQLRLEGDVLVCRGWQHAHEPDRAPPLRLPLKPA